MAARTRKVIGISQYSGKEIENLGNTETLCRELAKIVEVEEALIDLISIAVAGLSARELIAEESVVKQGACPLCFFG